jgi:hypothetical protein
MIESVFVSVKCQSNTAIYAGRVRKYVLLLVRNVSKHLRDLV